VVKARAESVDSNPPKKRTAASGRVTPPASRDINKRYTAPIPKNVRHSPRWYGLLLLVLLVAGLLVIVGNYVGIMPGGTSNWYLVGGLFGIVVGAMMATQYH
jgi:hypothetical protein